MAKPRKTHRRTSTGKYRKTRSDKRASRKKA